MNTKILKDLKVFNKNIIFTMKKYYYILFILIGLISCEEPHHSNNCIEIQLEDKFDRQAFNPSVTPLSNIDLKSIKIKALLKNIDTFSIQRLPLINRKESNLYIKNSKITNEEFLKSKLNLYIFTAFKRNNNQIIIVDTNQNLNFNDDEIIEFSPALRDQLKSKMLFYIDSIPRIEVNYSFYNNENISTKKYFFTILPFSDYMTYKKLSPEIIFNNRHQLVVEKEHYHYGEFSIEAKRFKVAYLPGLFRNKIKIQQVNLPFSKKIESVFLIKDTIKLDKSYYLIDSVCTDNSKLFIKKLSFKQKRNGRLKGDIISNFMFEELNTNQHFNIDNLLKNKNYLLIDFWGTWCAPCVELTPDIVKLHKENISNLNILSVAHQKNKLELVDYIKKNNMNWNNVIIDENAKGKNTKSNVLNSLRIYSYPTFILINKKREILYRGVGKPALDEIKKMIGDK